MRKRVVQIFRRGTGLRPDHTEKNMHDSMHATVWPTLASFPGPLRGENALSKGRVLMTYYSTRDLRGDVYSKQALRGLRHEK